MSIQKEKKSEQGLVYYASSRASNITTIASGSTCQPDVTLGDCFFFTANQNFTLNVPTTPPNGFNGTKLRLYVYQDATGSRTITLGTGFRTQVGGISLSTPPFSLDIIELHYDGFHWDAVITKNFQSNTYVRPTSFTTTGNATWANTANITDGSPSYIGDTDSSTGGTADHNTISSSNDGCIMGFSTQVIDTSKSILVLNVTQNNGIGTSETITVSGDGGTTYPTTLYSGISGSGVYKLILSGITLTSNDLINLKIKLTTSKTNVSNPTPPPATLIELNTWGVFDCYVGIPN